MSTPTLQLRKFRHQFEQRVTGLCTNLCHFYILCLFYAQIFLMMVCRHLMGPDNGKNVLSPRPELGSLSFSVSLQENSWVLLMTYSLAWARLVWQLVEAMERSLKSVSTPSSSSVWSPMACTSKTCWAYGECEADGMVVSLGGKAWMICLGQPNVL